MPKLVSVMDLRYINGIIWYLLHDFMYVSDIVGTLTVPAGFITDFNSVPRILWRIIPPAEFGEAGLVHDMLYRDGKFERAVCDRVHREILILLGAPKWKVDAMYWGLRIGGWKVWNEYRSGKRKIEGPDPNATV